MNDSNERDTATVSVILPARNEAQSLRNLLPSLGTKFPEAELIVVDDGSTDETADVARRLGAKVVSHRYPMGNGAAIKSGARAARGEILMFMDADGQHSPDDAAVLLHTLEEGYDMVVGARSRASQASLGRTLANSIYNRVASWITGHKIADLTSGLRVVRADMFREFLFILPNGFSYPTTITMAFFRAGYTVAYVPIHAFERDGKSHIRPLADGLRFLVIIFRVGTLYSPLKVFAPAAGLFFLVGLGHYVFTFLTMGRFTNMSALLFSVAVVVFLIGLVSEQITALMYQRRDRT